MPHRWTSDDDARLRELIDSGHTYAAAAERLRADGGIPEATPKSVELRAQRIGANPGHPSREPHVTESVIPRGIRGGERFKKMTVPVSQGDRIVVMGDAQIPFHDEKTFAAVEQFVYDYQPNVIIWAGDMWDCYEASHYDKNPARQFRLQDELDIGEKIQLRWAHAFPAARRIVILGNHEDRIRKHIWAHPGLSSLRALDVETLFSAGDTWDVLPYGSYVRINDTIIEHGDAVRSAAGASARAQYAKRGTSVIIGHVHRLSFAGHRNVLAQNILIENGCLCRLDPEYGPSPDWTQGFTTGYVNNGSIHWATHRILVDGFRAEGRFYKRDH